MADPSPKVLGLIAERPDYLPLVRRVVTFDTETYVPPEGAGIDLGWQWHDLVNTPGAPVRPNHLKMMVSHGVLRITYRSNRSTHYRLAEDPEAAKAAVELAGGEHKPPDLGPPMVPEQLFSFILGYEDIKGVIRMALRSEEPVHVLFIGPPATAKSLFLDDLSALPGARYALGASTTKAGITRYLMEERPRYLVVDEIEKMAREDMAALLSVMEGGRIAELKVGRTGEDTLPLRVFAACNRIESMPHELRDRFMRFHLREYTSIELEQVIAKVLTVREGLTAEAAAYVARQVAKDLPSVRDGIRIGRLVKSVKDQAQLEVEVDRLVGTLQKYQRP